MSMEFTTEKEWHEIFSKRVRERMHNLDINQNELADKIGVTPAAMSCYLRGFRTPRVDVIVKMSRVLDCSTDYLINFGYVKLDDRFRNTRED